MAKKDKKSKEAKKARTAEKTAKNAKKGESKDKKLAKKRGDDSDEEDVDLDEMLKQLALDQQAFEEVRVETVDKPAKRVNAAMVGVNNNGRREIFLFGGEYTNTNSHLNFHNDLNVFSPDTEVWKKFTSQNSPLPRSSHAMCYHPSGILVLHGGEFASPKQSTFHHYSDTWILDAGTKEWTKIDTKGGPSARSGHRMACWKNYVVLHGGFRDLGTMTTYLDDVWVFDVLEHKWNQLSFPSNHPLPDARSGHSLIPTEEGIALYGGYCKVKAGKNLQKGKVLSDGWTLKMKSDLTQVRWDRRRKVGWQPSPRVGCSMQFHKKRGVLFGGVYDFEETEESLDSEFYNQLLTYNLETNRWFSLNIRENKERKKVAAKDRNRDQDLEDLLNEILSKANLQTEDDLSELELVKEREAEQEEVEKKEYAVLNHLPHPRFNAMTCVLNDTFYVYGGMYEMGESEFLLDSFYAIDLGKLNGVQVFWEDLSQLESQQQDEDDEESDDEEDDDEEDEETDQKLVSEEEEEDEEEEVEEAEMEVPDLRPWLPHPKPFETLRAFYLRTGPQFLEWSISQNRGAPKGGKYLKMKAFELSEDRWWERREYLQQAEDSLEEAGITDVVEKDFKTKSKRR